MTGITLLAVELAAKRLEILKDAVPRATRITLIWNPANPVNAREFREAQAAASVLAVTLLPVELRSPDELEAALGATARQRADAVWILSSPVTFLNRPHLIRSMIQNRLPTMCAIREYALAGSPRLLWPQLRRSLPSRGLRARQDSQGRQARRLARRATDQVRDGRQHKDCEAAQPRTSAILPRPSGCTR